MAFPLQYVRSDRVWLKSDSAYSEKWVQGIIASDPTVLGLGEVELRDMERRQPRAGRLDLLLQEVETRRRYEVELQLGATDETHIVRTIEYWDIERRRYPHYDHCAVIVAEDITSRFLNVLSLFNSAVPLIAIQMHAIKVGEHVSLVFTRVVDELARGLVDEDEDAQAAPADRAYWENKASASTVGMTDELHQLVQDIDRSLELKYTRHYIGLTRQEQPNNFAAFRPKRNSLTVELKLEKSEEIDQIINNAGLEQLTYQARQARGGGYAISLTKDSLQKNRAVLVELLRLAYVQRNG